MAKNLISTQIKKNGYALTVTLSTDTYKWEGFEEMNVVYVMVYDCIHNSSNHKFFKTLEEAKSFYHILCNTYSTILGRG